jgi:hypothetical protein
MLPDAEIAGEIISSGLSRSIEYFGRSADPKQFRDCLVFAHRGHQRCRRNNETSAHPLGQLPNTIRYIADEIVTELIVEGGVDRVRHKGQEQCRPIGRRTDDRVRGDVTVGVCPVRQGKVGQGVPTAIDQSSVRRCPLHHQRRRRQQYAPAALDRAEHPLCARWHRERRPQPQDAEIYDVEFSIVPPLSLRRCEREKCKHFNASLCRKGAICAMANSH